MSLQDFLFPSESFFFSRGACRVLLSLKDCFLRCLWEDGYLPAGSLPDCVFRWVAREHE